MSPIGRLHVITDEVIQDRFDHVTLARLAIDGGADVIQYREKRPIADRARLAVAEALARLCEDRGAQLLIDDRADLAALVGAGLHVGPNDVPVDAARRIVRGPIGATANRLDMATDPEVQGADYLGCGPVFATSSKGSRPPPLLGLDGLRAIVAATSLPILAIGGVHAARVAEVIGAIALADDPSLAAAELRRAIDEAVASR